jgi:hypothetical protein
MNRLPRYVRWCMMFASGAVLLQTAGCDLTSFLQVLNTVFFGVMAGAGYVIIKNV